MSENPHAGQGPVLLDIGGRIGALVIAMPPWLAGVEIEARPVGSDPPAHLPHVEVLDRPGSCSAVFAELETGSYELYERPAGPVRLTATVTGGRVAYADWPA
jgi:hypothetical protein